MYASPAPAMGQYPGQYYAPAPKKSNTCCYSLCSLIVFTIIIYAIHTSVPYLNPNPPEFAVVDLSISEFSVSDTNFTASTKLSVDLNITNTNAKVGIKTKEYSVVKMNYKNAFLCNGTVPSFYQDVMNSTVITIAMDGTNAFDKSTKAYLDADVKNGKVQLDMRIIFTVSPVVEGKAKPNRDVVAKCKIVVDNLDTTSEIRILSSNCTGTW